MSGRHNDQSCSWLGESYTYPQFVIDEKTGQVEVNFIDWASGRVVRHIPTSELSQIVRKYSLKSNGEK